MNTHHPSCPSRLATDRLARHEGRLGPADLEAFLRVPCTCPSEGDPADAEILPSLALLLGIVIGVVVILWMVV